MKNIKNVVVFIAGFVVGVLIVYVFKNTSHDNTAIVNIDNTDNNSTSVEADNNIKDNKDDNAKQDVKDKSVVVFEEQKPGKVINIKQIDLSKYDSNIWVAIHEINDGVVGNVLGAALKQPTLDDDVKVYLLRGTVSGGEYAIALYRDDGDRKFDLNNDKIINLGSGKFLLNKFNIK